MSLLPRLEKIYNELDDLVGESQECNLDNDLLKSKDYQYLWMTRRHVGLMILDLKHFIRTGTEINP